MMNTTERGDSISAQRLAYNQANRENWRCAGLMLSYSDQHVTNPIRLDSLTTDDTLEGCSHGHYGKELWLRTQHGKTEALKWQYEKADFDDEHDLFGVAKAKTSNEPSLGIMCRAVSNLGMYCKPFSLVKYLLAICLFCYGIAGFAAELSERASAQILTCTPGNELYSVYGHSAVRIIDPELGIDWVYNYGTFDTNIDNFYLRFAQGRLDYMLSKSSYTGFMQEYVQAGRGVSAQDLLIAKNKLQELFDYLEWNALPENRTYRYHFFFDNCATRIRDLLDTILGKELYWNLVMLPGEPTFRDMIHAYQKDLVWADFGIDIALGLPCDAVMKPGEDMFLPDYLQMHLAGATLWNKPLVGPVKELLPERKQPIDPPWVTPTKVAWIWFFIVTALAIRSVRYLRDILVLEKITLWLLGLTGLLITFLWFFTDHTTTVSNLNIIWAFPTHLIAIFMARKHWMMKYWMFWSIVLFLYLIVGWVLPQSFHPAFFPLAATGFVSCFRLTTLTMRSGKTE